MSATSLNALNAFLVVARHLSYVAAARELGVSTSALSQSVRHLEEQVGLPLLNRTSRTVALTDAGRRLLEHAGPGIQQALEALKRVDARDGEVTGRVRLTVPSVSVPLLSELFPMFLQRYPKVALEVHVNDQLVNSVADQFDAGIRLIEAIDRDMVHVRLTPPTRVVVVGAPAYLERRGVPSKPEDLLRHDCVCIRAEATGAPWAWELARGKRSWRVPVRGAVTTNDAALMRSLALQGVGLLYALEDRVRADLDAGRLRVVLEAYAPEVSGLYLYFPGRSQVSPALKAFVEVARAFVRARS